MCADGCGCLPPLILILIGMHSDSHFDVRSGLDLANSGKYRTEMSKQP